MCEVPCKFDPDKYGGPGECVWARVIALVDCGYIGTIFTCTVTMFEKTRSKYNIVLSMS